MPRFIKTTDKVTDKSILTQYTVVGVGAHLVGGTLVLLLLLGGTLVQPLGGTLVQPLGGTLVLPLGGTLVQPVGGNLVLPLGGTLVQLLGGTLVQLLESTLMLPVGGTLKQHVGLGIVGKLMVPSMWLTQDRLARWDMMLNLLPELMPQ